MQLGDLVRPIENMSDEELREYLRQIRHRQTIVRPAAAKRVERAEKKEGRAKTSQMEKLIAGLSDEQRQALLSQLESGE